VGFHVMAPVMRDDLCYTVGAALESALAEQWGGVLMTKAPELEVTR
jgi:aspartyl-tRNA(Asn)/glutamyl-tRNA(Gln) amidotransferase subunit A